jgi:hypothetical protein
MSLYNSGGDPSIVPSRPLVTDYRAMKGNSSLKGFASVLFSGGIKINDIKIFSRGDERWVNPPDLPFTRRNGETAYKPLIEFLTSEERDRFQNAVLDAVDRFLSGEATK